MTFARLTFLPPLFALATAAAADPESSVGACKRIATAAQLQETIRRHYSGAWSVVVIAVKAAALGAALKYEHSATRGEEFPHLHAPLDIILEPAEGATVVSTFCTVPLVEQNFLQLWLDELTARHAGQNSL